MTIGFACPPQAPLLSRIFVRINLISGISGLYYYKNSQRYIDHQSPPPPGEDQYSLWVYGTIILTTLVYWTFGSLYIFLDITNRPKFLRKYKVQPETNEPVDRQRLIYVIKTVLINQFLVGVPLTVLSYRAMTSRGFAPIRQLPSFPSVLLDLFVFIIVEEIGFYYSHRLLHHRLVYKWIHKKHHEWTSPVAVTAIYCHPIEHIFSNLLPPFLGVYIMQSHIATAWLWFTMAICNTLSAHSGYHFPFFPSPESHDFHHLKFNYCFGVLGILDRLHGTDSLFREGKGFIRHQTLLTLVPAREVFPDDEPKDEKKRQ